ncbi:SRPBCC family protein [Jiangella aurantiaca]|uniref:SRPBCC family protein n=1 Tax=Jiangella aurantiaca TaxID=2530373 RepID=A0A4R5ALI5_9ACTN|nr:SRPBCC family protein [Jiangella aurantiaca]TDD71002.1 SRPBCC family protein [Jiangella aurantiaca]
MTGAHHDLSGQLHVALPPAEAFVLFTPRGEATWVPGWEPRFPVRTDDDTAPGTVFETGADGEHTIWVVLHRDPGRSISYARVTPGSRAGVVRVELSPGGDGGSDVMVGYELTALTEDAAAELQRFAAGYAEFLRSWEAAIAALSPP